MQRISINPRSNWQEIIESYGFEHHSTSSDEEPMAYWNEAAYYEFDSDEINRIEFATSQLEAMCLQLVEYVIDNDLFEQLHISPYAASLIRRSWYNFERAIYGRFDLSLGQDGSIKMLEYNADTPTSLFEASVAQWEWLQNRFPDHDQFNSIHEKLIEGWKSRYGLVHFASLADSESIVTTSYLEDAAKQAGIATSFIIMKDIGLLDGKFYDLKNIQINKMFKLYPWEWLLTDQFGENIHTCGIEFIEPAWKMVLSNKAMLPLLCEMFPRSKYLLPASENPLQGDYVRKPLLGREGNNVQVISNGKLLTENGGDYDWKYIYQQYHATRSFREGERQVIPIIGSWIINGQPAGIGIREDYGITTNTARFVPHLIRKTATA